MTIDANALIGAINRTLFAAGNDDLRPVMSGIFFNSIPSVRFVATDAHRLIPLWSERVQATSNAQFICRRSR